MFVLNEIACPNRLLCSLPKAQKNLQTIKLSCKICEKIEQREVKSAFDFTGGN